MHAFLDIASDIIKEINMVKTEETVVIFYEISGKINKTDVAETEGEPQKTLFGARGRIEYENACLVQTAVEAIAAKTSAHKVRLDVVELRSDKFGLIAIAEFDGLKKCPLKKAAEELFCELDLHYEIIDIDEITEETYCDRLKTAARYEYCDSEHEIREEFGIEDDRRRRDFTYLERKLEPIPYGNAKGKAPSVKQVKVYAESLVCENLLEEVERITHNPRYGTPVHYQILMEKMDDCAAVYNFMLDHLKRNRRILRGIVNVWSNAYQDRPDRFSKADLQKLYNKSEYGAVIIKSKYEEYSGDAAPAFYKQIKEICEVIKANKKKVLTILCFEKNTPKQQKAFMDNLENMTFLDIKETVLYKPQAIKFIKLLAKNDGLKNMDELFGILGDGKGYSRAEIGQLYIDWYAERQKAVEFPEYSNFAAVKKSAEEKVEGTAYQTLQAMIGLMSVKEQIDNIINFAKMQKLAKDRGLNSAPITKHMVFTGNPGTAKTTVARLFAQIMKDNDLLECGKFVEAGRADLVGEFVGHTAPKVRAKFREAKGGVLFIDEAYSLVDGKAGYYGDEAINTIVQEMENSRDNMIVIFAGYKKEMDAFIDRNSGLKSRVAHYVDFPDYDENELTEILELMAAGQGLTISCERTAITEIMRIVAKQENFGNGRFVRNLLDKARLKQAGRLAKMPDLKTEDILTLQAADFMMLEEYVKTNIRVMGFGA